MRPWQPRDRRGPEALKVSLIALVLLSVYLVVPGASAGPEHSQTPPPTSVFSGLSHEALAALEALPLQPVHDAASDSILPGSTPLSTAPTGILHLLVTFAYSNASRLPAFLAALSDPSSPEYHHYLTSQQFDAQYAPAPGPYFTASAYFGSFGVQNLSTQPDRSSISFDAPVGTVSRIFHDSLDSFGRAGERYVAPLTAPQLPGPLSSAITSVVGLGTGPNAAAMPQVLGSATVADSLGAAVEVSGIPAGYAAPPTVNGSQEEYLSDLQVAYDEQSLFAQGGYPTSTSIATILWSGTYTGSTVATECGTLDNGSAVGPWDPADLSSYFASTLPSGEPAPTVTPVALGGAPAPSCLASWDTTGATRENTVDLEGLGSTAPGAQLYDVYGPNKSAANLETAFGDILSPPGVLGASLVHGLENVSVIATSWGLNDQNDSAWFMDLEQAQARGITVLAASGDADNNPASPFWVGTYAEFPAAMAYNTFGDVAVGGTTLTLNPTNLHIASQTVWEELSTNSGGPAGSEGGIATTVVAEPAWQLNTTANVGLSGNGRGVPDLAGIANNSLVTITVDGYQYRASNATVGGAFYAASGTGVAVSVVAGLVAEIDHAVKSAGAAPLGFFDPALYYWANEEYANQTCGTTAQGETCGGVYASPLPALALGDVLTGGNAQYSARYGYDLATGWGSLDAYNFTIYTLNVSSTGVYGHLAAVQDRVDLAGLRVTSTYASGGGVNKVYNASLQQNLFLADSLGAPLYWIQNVVFLHHTTTNQWAMNFTAWASFPFWGIYPTMTVSEWWFPQASHVENLPLELNITTQFVPGSGAVVPHVLYSFGVKGTATLSLPVPGASYIIGTSHYTYSWQGVNYTDGPRGNASPPGFLAPQFGLVGGPGAGIGNFLLGTNGTIGAYVEPVGESSFELADSAALGLANHQTGETDSNLSYSLVSHGNWTFGYGPGSTEQGILEVQPARYAIAWNETGTPPGGTYWFVNLSSGLHLSAVSGTAQIVAELQNGSYSWGIGLSARGWASAPSGGTVVVSGHSGEFNVTLALTYGTVDFNATGPTFPFQWYANVTGGPALEGTTATLTASLTFGSYTYTISTGNESWAPAHHKGSFVIGPTLAQVPVVISLVTYAFKVIASYPVNVFVHWTITVGTLQKSGSITTPFTFLLPNGTYQYSVSGLPSGYTASITSGTVTIHGEAARLVIVITPPPPNGWLEGVWGYALVLGLIVLGALAVFVLLRRRKRRSRKQEESDRPERSRAPKRRSSKDWVDANDL